MNYNIWGQYNVQIQSDLLTWGENWLQNLQLPLEALLLLASNIQLQGILHIVFQALNNVPIPTIYDQIF